MIEHSEHQAGPYSIGHLGQTMAEHLPAVLGGASQLVSGFRGEGRLQPQTRVAVQLRLAKLFGCPVCRALFPRIGRRAGMSQAAIQGALRGEGAELPPEAGAALAWVDSIVQAGGAPPEVVESASLLTGKQRDYLVVWTRLDMVIHSVGLMFLPHSLIERATLA